MHNADSGRTGTERDPADVDTVLCWLESELDSRATVFEDDADFIREVVEGQVLAQDIAAQQELDRLRQKYEAWSQQFQQHMQDVEASLMRRGRPGRPPTNSSSQDTGHTPTSQDIPGTSISQPAVQSIAHTRGAEEVDMPQSPVPDEQQGGTAIAARSDAEMLVADPAAVPKPSTPAQVALQDAKLSLSDVPGSGGHPESSREGRVRKRDKLKKLLFH